MRNCMMGAILAAIILLPAAPGLLAQTSQQKSPPKGPPDLSGTWFRARILLPSGHNAKAFVSEENEPPMLPWAEKRYQAARKMRMNLEDSRGPDETNPHLYPFCIPPGMPGVFGEGLFEVVQSPGRVYILFESSTVQRIYTDGRKHPDGGPLSFMGHSIGRWEGDTLVVDTVDLNGLDGWAWMDNMGHLHTDSLRVVQRIRRVSHDRLEIDFQFHDPKTYREPWGGTRLFDLKPRDDPRWEVMESHGCEDRAPSEFLKKMRALEKSQ